VKLVPTATASTALSILFFSLYFFFAVTPAKAGVFQFEAEEDPGFRRDDGC
jgi:hypothetical protein